MSLMTWLARQVGAQRVAPVVATACVSMLVFGGLGALLVGSPAALEWTSGSNQELLSVDVADDADDDGLPDAVENLVGSDPHNPHTLGGGVPDGWLYHSFGSAIDWSDASILDALTLLARPEDLPEALRAPGAVKYPVIRDLYDADRAHAATLGYTGAWWLRVTALDPLDWDHDGDGISDAWLLQHGIHPADARPGEPSPGDAAFDLGQKYQRGLDPLTDDSDNDGLLDIEEISGSARLGAVQRSFTPTDPTRFSSRGDAIADGFVVRAGLDPHVAVAHQVLMPGGLSVAEAFQATLSHCHRTSNPCTWAARLDDGPIVDPTRWDSNGDGVPDAWSHRDPSGRIHPLDDARRMILSDSTSWDAQPWSGDPTDLRGFVVDSDNPLPAETFYVNGTLAYSLLRPATWNEAADGPWWGGLPPSYADAPDRLPAAVALRGWNLTVDKGLGGEEDLRTIRAWANPLMQDGDGDGIPDLDEYFGVQNGALWVRSDSSSPDTDGDGLDDADEARLGTNPLRSDTSGSFLTDGQENEYWTQRYTEAMQAFLIDPLQASQAYAWLTSGGVLDLERLLPEGILHGATSNILSADSDGDGLSDGAELFPNRFLPLGGSIARPATDPARADSDGDTLPDWWEVAWSLPRYAGCSAECKNPGGRQLGSHEWPIDPSKKNSFDLKGVSGDAEINLAGDELTKVIPPRGFSNRLAYKYDLNPYDRFTTKGDGLPDLFSIHWGVENVPGFIVDIIQEDVTSGGGSFSWTLTNMDRMSTGLTKRGFAALSTPVVIDPTTVNPLVTKASNLLGLFTGVEKGVWRFSDAPCTPSALPATGTRGEALPRAGLIGCWEWSSYALDLDVQHQTNPWLHDIDGDGLPDAWELAYTGSPTGADPSTITPTAAADGCNDPIRTSGLGEGPHCITFRDAYLGGLVPTRLDTDGGGMPDWLEVSLGLDPLDRFDDAGGEDWDGDGLTNSQEHERGTNPLQPDSDGDGLADGGDLGLTGNAKGNLCIPQTGGIVPNMDGRPGGALTYTQLHDLYASAGILRDDRVSNGCLAGETLFLAEGRLDPETGLFEGGGGGTDPLAWDTSGDGLPDGWVVFWREQSQDSTFRQRMDPHQQIASEQFNLMSLATQYKQGRPGDWVEPRDGPWWGGFDPRREDSDGDNAWFKTALDGDDAFDSELDNDGLVGWSDPSPSFADNADPVVRRGPSGYVTDNTRIFDAVLSRLGSMSRDADGDAVPDALDRARVHVTSQIQETSVDKDGSFLVTGAVHVQETAGGGSYLDKRQTTSHAGNGAAVHGATVLVLAVSSDLEHPLGYGFTGEDGSFTVTASFGSVLNGPTPTGAAVVAGVRVEAGQTVGAPSTAHTLQPGPVQIVVEVHANDPQVQTVTFGQHATVEAYKTVSGGTYTPPGQTHPLRAVALDGNGSPVLPAQSVRHTAEAIFSARSSAASIDLLAHADLQIDPPAGPVRLGDPLPIGGILKDTTGTPLAAKSVDLRLVQGAKQSHLTRTTSAEGLFEATFSTAGFQSGPAEVHIEVDVGDGFLLPPNTAPVAVALSRQSSWSEMNVAGEDIDNAGVLLTIPDPTVPVTVSGTLKDHLGNTMTSLPVRVSFRSSATTISQVLATTDAQGRVSAAQAIPLNSPLDDLELVVEADIGPSDIHVPFSVFLRPTFATDIVLLELETKAGDAATLQGRLLRSGHPVQSPGLLFVAASTTSSESASGTDANGVFRIPVPAAPAGVQTWQVRFTGSDHLQPSPQREVQVVHKGSPVLSLEGGPALRSEPVNVTGAFSIPAGGSVAGHTVHVGWDGQTPAAVTTGEGGLFKVQLPGRQDTGRHRVVASYAGVPYLADAIGETQVDILAATTLHLRAHNITVSPDGLSETPLVNGMLSDDQGTPLPSRTLEAVITLPDGTVQALQPITDATGGFAVQQSLLDQDQAGSHHINITYNGRTFEAPTNASDEALVTHKVRVVIHRAPGAVEAGAPLFVRGHLVGGVQLDEPLTLQVALGARVVATVPVQPGQPWSIQVTPAALPNGTYTLSARLQAAPGVEPDNATQPIRVLSPIDADIKVIESGSGRDVRIQLRGPEGQSLEGVQVDLVRISADGSFRGKHQLITGPDASVRLHLDGGMDGDVVLVGLKADGLFLRDQQTIHGVVVADSGGSVSFATMFFIVLGVVLSGALGATYWWWRRSQRSALGAAFDEGYRLALDGGLPLSEVISRVYETMLEILRTDGGYEPADEATVRDIAQHVTRQFRLPGKPMKHLTRLFEIARYSPKEPPPGGRRAALSALRAVSDRLGARVRLVRGGT